MNAKIRAMRVAVRRMLYAVSLMSCACGGQVEAEPTEPPSFTALYCEQALSCPGDAPIVAGAWEEMVRAETTWDGCLEVAEELRDGLPELAVTDFVDRMTSDPCLWEGYL